MAVSLCSQSQDPGGGGGVGRSRTKGTPGPDSGRLCFAQRSWRKDNLAQPAQRLQNRSQSRCSHRRAKVSVHGKDGGQERLSLLRSLRSAMRSFKRPLRGHEGQAGCAELDVRGS